MGEPDAAASASDAGLLAEHGAYAEGDVGGGEAPGSVAAVLTWAGASVRQLASRLLGAGAGAGFDDVPGEAAVQYYAVGPTEQASDLGATAATPTGRKSASSPQV